MQFKLVMLDIGEASLLNSPYLHYLTRRPCIISGASKTTDVGDYFKQIYFRRCLLISSQFFLLTMHLSLDGESQTCFCNLGGTYKEVINVNDQFVYMISSKSLYKI